MLSLLIQTHKLFLNHLPEDDPKQRKPDISIAKEKINWEPKISLS